MMPLNYRFLKFTEKKLFWEDEIERGREFHNTYDHGTLRMLPTIAIFVGVLLIIATVLTLRHFGNPVGIKDISPYVGFIFLIIIIVLVRFVQRKTSQIKIILKSFFPLSTDDCEYISIVEWPRGISSILRSLTIATAIGGASLLAALIVTKAETIEKILEYVLPAAIIGGLVGYIVSIALLYIKPYLRDIKDNRISSIQFRRLTAIKGFECLWFHMTVLICLWPLRILMSYLPNEAFETLNSWQQITFIASRGIESFWNGFFISFIGFAIIFTLFPWVICWGKKALFNLVPLIAVSLILSLLTNIVVALFAGVTYIILCDIIYLNIYMKGIKRTGRLFYLFFSGVLSLIINLGFAWIFYKWGITKSNGFFIPLSVCVSTIVESMLFRWEF